MKLELKHLVGYLPYGLKFELNLKDVQVNYKNEIRRFTMTCSNVDLCLTHGGKPILRPLSDLTKEIDGVVHAIELGKLDIDIKKHDNLFVDKQSNPIIECRIITKPFGKVLKVTNGDTWLIYLSFSQPYRCHHYVIDYLFQHHFDVYGLIENGLAIDINTLRS